MKQVSFHKSGFTLIELLVVMAIIAALAGLTLAGSQYAILEGKRKRAVADIAALGLAIGAYKADNGDYPRDPATTDMVDAKSDPDTRIPPLSLSPYLMPASVTLYMALSGDTDASGTIDASEKGNTVYFHFTPNMLSLDGNRKITAVMDPFRNCYGYSTIGSAPTTTGTQAGGYNPTYDLWSTLDPDKKGPQKATVPDFTNLWRSNFR